MKYSRESIQVVVNESLSWAEVCRKLGIRPMSGSQAHLKKRAIFFGVHFSHFLGKRINLGRKFGYKRSIEEYLSNRHAIISDRLKKRLFAEGLKDKMCEHCGLT